MEATNCVTSSYLFNEITKVLLIYLAYTVSFNLSQIFIAHLSWRHPHHFILLFKVEHFML